MDDLKEEFLSLLPKEQRDKIKEKLEEKIKNSEIPNLQFILSNCIKFIKDQTKSGETNFINDFFSDIVKVESLWKLLIASPVLARAFFKHPTRFTHCFPTETTREDSESLADFENGLKEILSTIPPDLNQADLLKELRLIKIHCYLKIVLADLQEIDTFELTVAKISSFAEKMVQFGFKATGLSQLPIAAIAMGKLGGSELNYQSDIDIIFVVSDEVFKVTKQNERNMIALIEERIKKLITLFQTYTEDGYLYKVDLQVRPDGHSGTTFMTMKQYHDYYHHRALEWEFQALIKARWIAGQPQLGEDFHNFKKKFVFQDKYSTNKMLLQISAMKSKIETHFNEHNFDNVKLGPGGIRDIEFIVQFLQILHGKLSPSLNDSNTISTLKKLWNYEALSFKEYQNLYDNYIFLRRVEHLLQLDDLRPVRKLPKEETSFKRIIATIKGKDIEQNLFSFKDISHFHEHHRHIRFLNGELFEQLFDITHKFSNKLKQIFDKLTEQDYTVDNLDHHIQNLESDYFLTFDSEMIIKHINLIEEMIQSQDFTTQVKILNNKNNNITINIITPDSLGVFSLICGLISSYSINLISGSSFTYSFVGNRSKIINNQPKSIKNVFRNKTFLTQQQTSSIKKHPSLIICSMQAKVASPDKNISKTKLQSLKQDLIHHCSKVDKNNISTLMEQIAIKIIELIKDEDQSNYLKPIHIKVTNDSHPLYTVLDIESEDSFLFLYHFTQAISSRNFYLVKIEFNTQHNFVRNKLFLTNQHKEKIQDDNQLEELKTTILIIKYFSYYLTQAPNPQLALKQFVQLINEFSQNYEETFQDLLNHGPWFKHLAVILGTTETFFEDFLRSQSNHIKQFLKSKNEIDHDIDSEYLTNKLKITVKINQVNLDNFDEMVNRLNQFKDEMLFQIDMRWFSRRITDFREFCIELSRLTDLIIHTAYLLAAKKAQLDFNLPSINNQVALVALGKWGAEEMGYASDVELVFVYELINGSVDDPTVLKKYYEQIAKSIPKIIKSKKNGIFEVDMRLRPHQESGAWATAITTFEDYYMSGSAKQFERFSLTRLRIINQVGQHNQALCKKIIQVKDQFVYSGEPVNLDNFNHLRERQKTELVPNQKINLKLSNGGIVDAEYLIQYLSILHGSKYPNLRVSSTFKGIKKLEKLGILSKKDTSQLESDYLFLRGMIDCLRIVRGNAKDLILPDQDNIEFIYLKRRAVIFGIINAKDDLFSMIMATMERMKKIVEKYY